MDIDVTGVAGLLAFVIGFLIGSQFANLGGTRVPPVSGPEAADGSFPQAKTWTGHQTEMSARRGCEQGTQTGKFQACPIAWCQRSRLVQKCRQRQPTVEFQLGCSRGTLQPNEDMVARLSPAVHLGTGD